MAEDTDTDKDTLLKSIYYDVADGYDTIYATYKRANRAMPSITLEYVKQWMARQKSRQGMKSRTWNSYVSPEPKYQYDIDLADFNSLAGEDGYKFLLVCIDTFTKYGWGIPMRSKDAGETTLAMREIFNKMGVCKQIFSDDEASFSSRQFKDLLAEHNIKHLITLGHASHAEKFIQRIKNMVMIRIQNMGENVSWVKLLSFVFEKYNNTKHETIGMTPRQATQGKNEIEVLFNIATKAKYARQYPPLKVGSLVRKHQKADKYGKMKSWIPKWSDRIYEVERIANGMYYLKNDNINNGILRHDLLRIDEAQEIPDIVKASNAEKLTDAIPTKRLTEKTRFYKLR